jgi:predicted dehydrogenase
VSIERMKIGQIGTTHAHAEGKMSALRNLPDYFDVVGVVEPDLARQRSLADTEAYQGLPWMKETDLLEKSGLEIVAVETGVDELVPTAARCIQAGLHVHVDKAPGEALAPFRALLQETSDRGLVVQMGYMLRCNSAFRFLFDAVRAGWLGEVFEVHGVISKVADERLRRQMTDYAGGAMFELGCHLIDPLVAILGKPERVTPYIKKLRSEVDGVADNMLAVFEFANATATIRSTLLEVGGAERRQLVVCGDRGTIEIRPLEPPELRMTLSESCGDFQAGCHLVDLAPMPGRYEDQLVDLARIARGETENEYPPTHDLAVHESLLRACGLAVD